jgi:hypothetical protein
MDTLNAFVVQPNSHHHYLHYSVVLAAVVIFCVYIALGSFSQRLSARTSRSKSTSEYFPAPSSSPPPQPTSAEPASPPSAVQPKDANAPPHEPYVSVSFEPGLGPEEATITFTRVKSSRHKLDRVKAKRPAIDGREYDATIVNVFYATDRGRDSGPEEEIRYGWQRSPTGNLEYGECEVSIPDTHVMGGMESPSLLRFEFRPDPQKHIVLWKTTSFEEKAFYEKVSACAV